MSGIVFFRQADIDGSWYPTVYCLLPAKSRGELTVKEMSESVSGRADSCIACSDRGGG